MNKQTAVLTILSILISIDRHIDKREIDVLEAYIKKDIDRVHQRQDIEALTLMFSRMSTEEKFDSIREASEVLNSECSMAEKYRILEWAFSVIYADKRFNANEIKALEVLGKTWGIDAIKWGKELYKGLQQ